MRLIAVQVTKYRSIEQTPKLNMSSGMTVLIGPNNEGKSNLLNGVALGLATLQQLSDPRLAYSKMQVTESVMTFRAARAPRGPSYDWDRDYPSRLRDREPEGVTTILLEFELEEPIEIEQFRREVGSSLNGLLPIELAFGSDGHGTFRVRKRGPGARSLAKKADKVARFVSRRLDFQYVPAVRTADAAHEVIDSMVADALRQLEGDQPYKEAMRKVRALEAPVLRRMSKSITGTLREFLPGVKSVVIGVNRERGRFRRETGDIVIDDGAPTRLESKGDGVVSLTAIALVRHVAITGPSDKALILAVEEPESHLHPRSVRELRGVLGDIAHEHQVIVTTHSPLLVERDDIKANILVETQQARCATTISEIRESLGVRVGDNLSNSEVVLVVEGQSDRTAMLPLLATASSVLARALADGRLGLQSLAGGSNLSYQVDALDTSMIRVHCLLDDDAEATQAFEKAVGQGLLVNCQATFTKIPRRATSEFEDWVDPAVYEQHLRAEFGPVLQSAVFKSHRGKWSDRVRDTVVNDFGGHWSDSIEKKLKADIASLVAARPGDALQRRAAKPFASLVARLESLLSDS